MRKSPNFRVTAAPPGFALISARRPSQPSSATSEHLVFSDGLASVSVYIEAQADNPSELTTLAGRGTLNLQVFFRDGMRFTVLGDVPIATVGSIAGSIEQVSGNGAQKQIDQGNDGSVFACGGTSAAMRVSNGPILLSESSFQKLLPGQRGEANMNHPFYKRATIAFCSVWMFLMLAAGHAFAADLPDFIGLVEKMRRQSSTCRRSPQASSLPVPSSPAPVINRMFLKSSVDSSGRFRPASSRAVNVILPGQVLN